MQTADVLSGRLSFVGLADLLQFLGAAVAAGELRIFAENGVEGVILMKNGEVFDARIGREQGEEAFHTLFTWQEGRFLFIPGNPEIKREIHRNLTGLILDALRRMDEFQAIHAGKDTESSRDLCLKGPTIEYSDVVDEEFHRDGTVVVRQGRFGSWLWVILEGKVRLYKEVGGRSVPLFCLGKGAFIGSAASFALMNRPRSASVHVVGEALLGVLDSQRLAREFTTLGPGLRDLVLGLDRQLSQLGDLLARLRSSSAPLPLIPESWEILRRSEGVSGASFCRVARGKVVLGYKIGNHFSELASFPEGVVFADPMPATRICRDGMAFFGNATTRILPLEDGDAGMLWDRLSPTFRKMLGFSVSSIQTSLELIGEAIECKGQQDDA